MRFAYADPPYLGCAVRRYGDHPDAATYDTIDGHRDLITRLSNEYDGWAYSLSTPTLKDILPMCPADVRVMAWVKPFASFKPGIGVAYTWEPVIVRGGRKRTRTQSTTRDYVACPITLRRGLTGAKPEAFVLWLLDVLNVTPADTFDDLFPGSGAVQRAYDAWLAQRPLWEEVV